MPDRKSSLSKARASSRNTRKRRLLPLVVARLSMPMSALNQR